MPNTTRNSGVGFLVMIALCFAAMIGGDALGGSVGAWLAGFAFFGWVGWVNWWYARLLFEGRMLARRGRFEAATPKLEAALARFERLWLLDRFRLLLLCTPTASSYRESAQLALAHCHALAGDPRAFAAFERCVASHPKSSGAVASLRLLRLGARIAREGGRVTDPRTAANPDTALGSPS